MKTSSVGFKALLLIAVCAGSACASRVGAAPTNGAPRLKTTSARHHGVSSRIGLASRALVSGASEHGTLVIANHTGHPVRWDCAYLEVQLTNAHWPLERHPTPCGPTRTLPVGTTRLHFTLRASRAVCERSCTALPPGTYGTQLLVAPPFVHPPAVKVHVVARG